MVTSVCGSQNLLNLKFTVHNDGHLSDLTSTSETDCLHWGAKWCKCLLDAKCSHISQDIITDLVLSGNEGNTDVQVHIDV